MFDAKELLLSLIAQPVLISIIAGVFGEDYVLFLMILSGTGIISFWKVVIFGYIGVVLHDTVVYLAGRSEMFGKLFAKREEKAKKKKKNKWLMRLGQGGYILPMALSKFIFGTRVFATLYASQKEKNFMRYFMINLGLVLLWFVVMAPVGWYAGRGFTIILTIVQGIEKIFVIFVALVLIYFIINFIIKAFMKKDK
ncbi:MAG: hypothetical protein AABW80_04095 [Nanoarchaeota archaeon]